VGAQAQPVRQFIESFNWLLFHIVGMIMYLAVRQRLDAGFVPLAYKISIFAKSRSDLA
jgi:hypothetical protein